MAEGGDGNKVDEDGAEGVEDLDGDEEGNVERGEVEDAVGAVLVEEVDGGGQDGQVDEDDAEGLLVGVEDVEDEEVDDDGEEPDGDEVDEPDLHVRVEEGDADLRRR